MVFYDKIDKILNQTIKKVWKYKPPIPADMIYNGTLKDLQYVKNSLKPYLTEKLASFNISANYANVILLSISTFYVSTTLKLLLGAYQIVN